MKSVDEKITGLGSLIWNDCTYELRLLTVFYGNFDTEIDAIVNSRFAVSPTDDDIWKHL